MLIVATRNGQAIRFNEEDALSLIHIFCVISVKLQEAEFEGQTKAKLGNTEIRTLVSNMVYSKLMEFFEENPGVAKAIFEKATQAARARAAAKKARELVRRRCV